MKLKIDSKVSPAAERALEPYVTKLYDTPGLRLMAVAEIKPEDRNAPPPDSEAGLWVKARISALEIASTDQEAALREAQRALYLQRTAHGTLDEDGEMQLDERTLELTGGLLNAIEAARLTAVLRHWAAYARRVNRTEQLTLSEIRHELDTVATGLTAALDHARDDGDEEQDG
ncbi:hypothetical protein AB0I72_19420 [Nocardiopsis sp. NPDC049922]|uniref:hypothetical protein n=1 Tax=Nocardiopsis sp. NPDC049922 TaxID=3155157 RepID=UPI0033C04D76